MGGLSPLCPQPRGDLVLRSPARSSRGKPQPCESCPEGAEPLRLQEGYLLILQATGLDSFIRPSA